MTPDLSPIQRLADRISHCADPRAALTDALSSLSPIQLAHVRYDWSLWARAKQVVPAGPWRSFGLLTGIGFGKTRTLSEFVTAEVAAGRARSIGLCAQNEDKTFEVMVDGKSGLIATSPPWFKARWESKRVIWPNGAEAFPYTPEVPGAMRGPEHDLIWLSELVAWPAATRMEALDNIQRRARIGYGKMVWDTTPKRKHPIVARLLRRAEREPDKHLVVFGTMRENADNLTAGYVDGQYATYAGTQQGREELDGVFLDDDEGALWKQTWIDAHRRDRPASLARRIVSIDPALSDRKGTDSTGVVVLGLGSDAQVYVLADHTAQHAWEAWGALALRLYTDEKCDCVVVERNAGFDALAANLRACARDVGITVQVVDKDATTRHVPGTVYVKEVFSRRSKDERAQPVATAYERGRVSHVRGAALAELEEELTTWVPEAGGRSPNRIDALVHGVWELADLGDVVGDPGVVGLADRVRGMQAAGAAMAEGADALIRSDTVQAGDPRSSYRARTGGGGRSLATRRIL